MGKALFLGAWLKSPRKMLPCRADGISLPPCKCVADGRDLVCQAFTGCPGDGEPWLNRTGLRLFKAVSMTL